jgi:hypothetical protein
LYWKLLQKAAGGLFKLDARLVEARGAAKREGFRVMQAAHIAQPKVPKPPRRSAGAAKGDIYRRSSNAINTFVAAWAKNIPVDGKKY